MARKITTWGHTQLTALLRDLGQQGKSVLSQEGVANSGTGSAAVEAQIQEICRILRDPAGVELVGLARQFERVAIGQVVTLTIHNGTKASQKVFMIDGYAEPTPGPWPQVVSYFALSIQPLLGRKVGETRRVQMGGKTCKVTIEKVEPLDEAARYRPERLAA